MSDEKIESDLTKSLNEPKYEVWNGTSIYHLLWSAIGLNGINNQNLSIQLLNGYVEYKKKKCK